MLQIILLIIYLRFAVVWHLRLPQLSRSYNTGLRSQLEVANSELKSLRSRLVELESTRAKLVKVQQQALSLDKENKSMKQTLRYLQEELVKTGKKNLHQN